MPRKRRGKGARGEDESDAASGNSAQADAAGDVGREDGPMSSGVANRATGQADRQAKVWALRRWAEHLDQEQERRERLLERALATLQRVLDEAADLRRELRELHELARPDPGASDGDGHS